MPPHPQDNANPGSDLPRPLAPRKSLLQCGVSLIGILGILSSNTVWVQKTVWAQAEPKPETAASESSATSKVVDAVPAPVAPVVPGLTVAPLAPGALSVAPEAVPSAASADANQSYIDSTRYDVGATDRQGETPTTASQPQPASESNPLSSPLPVVQLPPTPTAIDLAPVAPSDYTVELGTTPSLRDYYQRSLRPPGRLGNGNISLLFPLAIPAPITSAFGWRLHPISGDRRFHSGTDIGAPMGTPVLAAYAGQVAIADFLGGYGLTVTVNHNQGSQTTLYGHLSEVFVKPGEMVQQGTVIGRVGSTGNSTGPHLHFEFRQLTPDGWTVMDAGTQLEYSLTQLVKALQTGQPLATGTIAGEAKFRASLQVEAKLSRSLQKTAITPLPTARN